MHRRTFMASLGAALCGIPAAIRAQAVKRPVRVGYLGDGQASSRASINLEPFRVALAKLGYVEGRNLTLDVVWSDGRNDRLPALAQTLVSREPDVIVTHGLPATRAAKNATNRIPIVVAVIAEIVESGIVESLARPGGNVTGLTDQLLDLSGKEVELLRAMVPSLRRVGVIWNRASETATRNSALMRNAASGAGLHVVPLGLLDIDELDAILESARQASVGGMLVVHDPLVIGNRHELARALLRRKMPAISGSPWLAEAGLLMAYGPDQTEMFRRAAEYVDKILRGARPSELPVEQPTRFELVINQATSQAIGLPVPQELLVRADKLIR